MYECTTIAAGAHRAIALAGSIHISTHAPPPLQAGNRVTGGPELVLYASVWMGGWKY